MAVVVVVADQLTKAWVDASFAARAVHPARRRSAPTPVLGELVRIAKTYNNGAIFGLFGNSRADPGASSSLVVIGLIVVYEWRQGARNALAR